MTKYDYEGNLDVYTSSGTYTKGKKLKLTKKAFDLGFYTNIKKALVKDTLTGMEIRFNAKNVKGANLDPKDIGTDRVVNRKLAEETIHSMLYELKFLKLNRISPARNYPGRYVVQIKFNV